MDYIVRMRFFSCLIVSSILTISVYGQVETPVHYTLQKDLVYTVVNNWKGRLDLYLPSKGKKHPLLINIHGGGWVHGKKETETVFTHFFDKNYVVANVEYRLADQAKAPAAIEDARCALLYLVNNASKFHIDLDNIIVMGGSAGGHLALMVGLLNDDPVFDAGCKTKKTFRIAAIIDKYGPSNLNTWDAMKKPNKASSTWPGTRVNDSIFLQSLSPVYYVKSTSPPVFIVHGDKDRTVAYSQSLELLDALKAAGVTVEMYTVLGGMHGNFNPTQKEEMEKRMDEFIEKALRFK